MKKLSSRPDAAPGLRPEALLLLASMRGRRTDADRKRLAELAREPVDWNRLLELAEFHRMMPLLYDCLKDCGVDGTPPEVLATLREVFDQNRFRNLAYLQELREIFESLNRNGIEAIAIKGPVQARAIYGNVGLRAIADLDIFVRRDDVLKTKPLLLERGYTPDKELASRKDLEQRENEWEWGFDDEGKDMRVEIHWQTMPGYSADYECLDEEVWDRTTTVHLGGVSVPVLTPEETVLYACMHGGEKHGWAYLRFLTDIVRMLECDWEIDWNRVLARASDMGKEQSLALAVYIASVFGGVPPPEGLRDRLRITDHVASLAGLARGRLFRDGYGLPGYHEWLDYVRFHARNGAAFPTVPKHPRLRYLRAILTPEFSDRKFGPDVGRLVPALAWCCRPVRLFGRHGRRLFSRLG